MVYIMKMIIERLLLNVARRGKMMFLTLVSPVNMVLFGSFAILIVSYLHRNLDVPLRYKVCPPTYWAQELDDGFEGFDNITGVVNGPFIVPNFVHFLRYGEKLRKVNFMDAVNILAAFRNQKPEKIFFHTNFEKFEGKYWETLMKIPGLNETIEFQFIEPVTSIFGQPLNSWYHLWHSSDILRIDILRRFGGIFIDNDVYLVRNMDRFRRFEMTLEITDEKAFGTMTLVAHKDARFLRLWLNSYKMYYGHLWYYNAGEKPKLEVLDSRPELVHNVNDTFGVRDLRKELYIENWPEWREQYTIHTLVRHLSVDYLRENKFNLKFPVTFNENNIVQYNVTILDMVTSCCQELR